MSRKRAIVPARGPKPGGPYSPAIQVGDLLFCAGQIPMDPQTGQLVTGDIKAATRRALDNLVMVLEAAGFSAADVVKTTVFLKDMNDFAAMNEAYGAYFPQDPPARTTVQVARLPRDADLEIELIAYRGAK